MSFFFIVVWVFVVVVRGESGDMRIESGEEREEDGAVCVYALFMCFYVVLMFAFVVLDTAKERPFCDNLRQTFFSSVKISPHPHFFSSHLCRIGKSFHRKIEYPQAAKLWFSISRLYDFSMRI